MNKLEEILSFNKKFVDEEEYVKYKTSNVPDKKMVVLSCMDTRLTELLPKAMNFKNGDVKLIKNAGATVMHPFGSIIRSIIVAVYEYEADDVLVVGHYGCGMSNLNSEITLDKAIKRGISPNVINTLNHSGINVNKWLKGFDSVQESVNESVEIIKNHPLMPKDVRVHGLLIDPLTGKVDVVVDGYKEV